MIFSAVKVKALFSSKTLVSVYKPTRRKNQEVHRGHVCILFETFFVTWIFNNVCIYGSALCRLLVVGNVNNKRTERPTGRAQAQTVRGVVMHRKLLEASNGACLADVDL